MNKLQLTVIDDDSQYLNFEVDNGLNVEMGRFGEYERKYRMNIQNREYLKNIIRICKWQLQEMEKESK